MPKYIQRHHDKKGMTTEYSNRVDLDTALKQRGMDGLYGHREENLEKKEKHAFVLKKALEKGEDYVRKQHIKGKLFNKKDSENLI